MEDPDGFEAGEGETRTDPRGWRNTFLDGPWGWVDGDPDGPQGCAGTPGGEAAGGRPHYLGQ